MKKLFVFVLAALPFCSFACETVPANASVPVVEAAPAVADIDIKSGTAVETAEIQVTTVITDGEEPEEKLSIAQRAANKWHAIVDKYFETDDEEDAPPAEATETDDPKS